MQRHQTARAALAAGAFVIIAACSDAPTTPAADPPAMQRAAAAPVEIRFEKDFQGAVGNTLVWHGTVRFPDDTSADLVSTIDLASPGTREAGNTLHATIRWSITGAVSMEVETAGVINLGTGLVRSNGSVIAGAHAGARVHQEGQLDGFDAAGFLRVQAR